MKKYRTDLHPVIRPVSVNKRFQDPAETSLAQRGYSKEKSKSIHEKSTLEDDQRKGLHWRAFRLNTDQREKLNDAQSAVA